MNTGRLVAAVLIIGMAISACGGNDTAVAVDCDEALKYQNREVGKRVVAPEGLDQLDEFAEMPIPKADPEAAKPLPGKCVDRPPTLRT
ncbi:MAG: hypothetical protein KC572_08545 [Gammaproteobacteria bacterium]|nr:hypothetical protein [Gammaproteobacteria bacterium]